MGTLGLWRCAPCTAANAAGLMPDSFIYHDVGSPCPADALTAAGGPYVRPGVPFAPDYDVISRDGLVRLRAVETAAQALLDVVQSSDRGIYIDEWRRLRTALDAEVPW